MEKVMGRETELKLALAANGWRRFLHQPLLATALAAPRTQTLRSIYFDTPDFELRRRRVALRLRRAGRRWLQTVKCASVASGGLSTRPEWEQPFTGRFDFSMIEDRSLRQLLERLRNRGTLVEVFETRFERREWRFAAGSGEVLLMADRGTIEAAGRSEAISELEIELAGAPIDALFDLAEPLVQSLPLRAESRSKAQRGYDLIEGSAPAALRAGGSPINPEAGAISAFRAVALDCLQHYQTNEAGALQSDAPEFVHQMRVALRRLRSALRLFSPALPEGMASDLTLPLRALASDLGELRDRDVLHSELLAPVLASRSDGDVIRLEQALHSARQAVRERMLAALQDGRQARLMVALLHALHRLPADDEGAKGLHALAYKRLARAHARMVAASRDASPGDVGALHALRIDVKRLRYAIEFFSPLLGPGKTRRALNALVDAQEQLGFLNDLSQAGPMLLAVADDDAQLLAAVGQVAKYHMPRYRKVVGNAPKMLRRLSRMAVPR
jgi:inorganic triphosphatase YgiF